MMSQEEGDLAVSHKVDVIELAQEAVKADLISQDVLDQLSCFHPQVPDSTKQRYLLGHLKAAIKDNEQLLLRMTQVFLKFRHQFEQLDIDKLPIEASSEGSFELSVDHFSELTELLVDYAYMWRPIGMSLKFRFQDLNNIEATPNLIVNAPQSFLAKILEDWLQRKHEQTLPPTVGSLERALNSCSVGLGTVAERVRAYPFSPKHNKLPLNFVKSNVQLTFNESVTRVESNCTSSINGGDLIVAENNSVLMEVEILSNIKASFNYQWLKQGQALSDSADYFGTTEPVLCVANASIEIDGSEFSCAIRSNATRDIIKTNPVTLAVSCPLDKHKEALASLYLFQPEVPEDWWPPVVCDKYISLTLIRQDDESEYTRSTVQGNIEDYVQQKEAFNYNDVFEKLRKKQTLFIEGRPGCGKTTLVHKITRDWAAMLRNKNMRLVLFVSLRVLSNLNKPNLDLSDILRMFDTLKLTKQDIEERQGNGVCFLFDDFDEFSPSEGTNSIVHKIINRKYLSKSIVILASRPAALAQIKKKANQVIEVVGFLKEQVLDYFNCYHFSDHSKSTKAVAYLSSHLNILHMCYLPIHASMIAFLFEVTGKVPKTETEMYQHFTCLTLMRNLSKSSQDLVRVDLAHLDEEAEKLFNQICRLALEKTIKNKQVLEQNEVESFFQRDRRKDISLGLITVDRAADLYGFKDIYTFLHLTFQEYLAARHISMLSDEEQNQQIQEHGEKNHMMNVWKFCCGLLKFDEQGDKFKNLLMSTSGKTLLHIHCAYESQQSTACRQVLEHAQGCISIADEVLTGPDIAALSYVTSHLQRTAKLSITNCSISTDGTVGLDLPNILDLSLSHLSISPETLNSFLHFSITLEKLSLVRTMGLEEVKVLSQNLQLLPNLTKLDVSCNNICDKGATILATNLQSCASLQQIVIHSNGMSRDGVSAIFASLRCCSLEVRVEDVILPNDDELTTGDLVQALTPCHKLLLLHSEVTSQFLEVFLSFCANWQDLHHLSLTSCLLYRADIGLAIADSLLHFQSLKALELKKCRIGRDGISALVDTLSNCTQLQLLDLDSNSIGAKEAAPLFKCVQSHADLLDLVLCANLIGDQGAKALLLHPLTNSHFQSLDLSANEIGDEGAQAIALSLTACTASLKILKLHVNRISDHGAISLSSLLKHCCNIQEVHLGVNLIGGKGAQALAKSLCHCTQLHKLDLHHNPIDIKSAETVTHALHCCPLVNISLRE